MRPQHGGNSSEGKGSYSSGDKSGDERTGLVALVHNLGLSGPEVCCMSEIPQGKSWFVG